MKLLKQNLMNEIMMKTILSILILFLIPFNVYSQIVDSERVGDKFIFVDKKGKQVGNSKYESTLWEGFYGLAKVGGLYTVVDSKGKEILPRKFSSIYFYDDTGLFEVCIHRDDGVTLYGLYTREGKEIVPCEFVQINTYKRAITVKNEEGLYGAYSYRGDILYPAEYRNILIFDAIDDSEDYEYSKLVQDVGGETKIGIVDKKTIKTIIPCEYEDCIPLSAHYVKVNKGGVFRDTSFNGGSLVYTPTLGGKWGVMKDGKNFIPCEYADIKLSDEFTSLFAIQKEVGGKWALWSKNKELTDYIFDLAPEFNDDVAQASVDGKIQIIKNPLKNNKDIKLLNNYALDAKAAPKQNGRAVSRYPEADSDVDVNIPNKSKYDHRFAFILANENYDFAPVPYALNDARAFAQYCEKLLGVPKKHIFSMEDATYAEILTTVSKLEDIAESYDGDAELIFYYAGHGVPDESNNSAYLVPIDSDIKNINTTGYSLKTLYDKLSSLKVKGVYAFIDACFSGARRENESLLAGRGIAIDTKMDRPTGKMVAFTASTGAETAHQLESKKHGLFTYYLLKYIQENKGIPSMGDMTDYVTKNVKRQSVVINNKKQTPTVSPSKVIENDWRQINL